MIKSVDKAIRILELLNSAGLHGWSLAELARDTGLKPPTTHNLVNTLVQTGYAEQCPQTRRYRLGPRALELGRTRDASEQLTQRALPAIQALHRQCHETVILALYRNRRRETVLALESDHELKVGAAAGSDRHFYETATGRVLLGLLPATDLDALLEELGKPGSTWPEATAPKAVKTALARIRQEQLCVLTKTTAQIQALAVPVLLPGLNLTAALGLYYPLSRNQPERIQDLTAALRETAAQIQHQMERT